MIEREDKEFDWIGEGPSDGPKRTMQSARSEMFGLWGLLTHVRLACECYDISETDIAIRTTCDNKGSIKKCTDKFEDKGGMKTHLGPDYDIEAEMHAALRALPFRPKFDWVKGHQTVKCDKHDNEMPLSREAIMNNIVDELAGDYLQNNQTGPGAPTEHVPHLPAARASNNDSAR